MAANNEETAQKNNLSKEQKIGFVLLLLFAVFAVALGILQIRNTMRAPFALNNAVPPNIKDEVDTVDALRFRDIDRDGLNDFDELYVYATSPYLADTDSDGVSDKDEIDKGSDPLCVPGQDCLNNPIARENYSPVSSTGAALGLEEPVAVSGADLTATLTDPVQIRKLLINAGLNPDVLKNISDSDLLSLVAQTLKTTGPSTGSADNISLLNSLISSSTKP